MFAEAQQRYVAMDMAKEVSTWQAAVLKQCEQHSMEKTAQVGRLGYVVNLANEKIAHLEGLSGSISVVYSLAGEAMRLKSIISKTGRADAVRIQSTRGHEDAMGSIIRIKRIVTCTIGEYKRGTFP